MTYRILGTTEENTTCDCCGKRNLKKTVVLESESGIVYFGVDCAAAAVLGSKKQRGIMDNQAEAVSYAKAKIEKYGRVQKVADLVWNKFGYCCGFNSKGEFKISNFATI